MWMRTVYSNDFCGDLFSIDNYGTFTGFSVIFLDCVFIFCGNCRTLSHAIKLSFTSFPCSVIHRERLAYPQLRRPITSSPSTLTPSLRKSPANDGRRGEPGGKGQRGERRRKERGRKRKSLRSRSLRSRGSKPEMRTRRRG